MTTPEPYWADDSRRLFLAIEIDRGCCDLAVGRCAIETPAAMAAD